MNLCKNYSCYFQQKVLLKLVFQSTVNSVTLLEVGIISGTLASPGCSTSLFHIFDGVVFAVALRTIVFHFFTLGLVLFLFRLGLQLGLQLLFVLQFEKNPEITQSGLKRQKRNVSNDSCLHNFLDCLANICFCYMYLNKFSESRLL